MVRYRETNYKKTVDKVYGLIYNDNIKIKGFDEECILNLFQERRCLVRTVIKVNVFVASEPGRRKLCEQVELPRDCCVNA